MSVFEEAVIRDRNERNSLDKKKKQIKKIPKNPIPTNKSTRKGNSSKPAIFSVEAAPCDTDVQKLVHFLAVRGCMIKYFSSQSPHKITKATTRENQIERQAVRAIKPKKGVINSIKKILKEPTPFFIRILKIGVSSGRL